MGLMGTGGLTRLFASAGLLALASAALCQTEPAPSAAVQARFVEATRQTVLNYTKSLPDFLCTQTIRRYASFSTGAGWSGYAGPSFSGTGVTDLRAGTRLMDTLTVEVSFEDHSDRYVLTHLNGAPTTLDYLAVAGASSGGEFGSLLLEAFASKTEFRFRRWTVYGRRRAAVYTYRLDPSHSSYVLRYRDPSIGIALSAISGLRGEIVIERETHAVLRIEYIADSPRKSFPLKATSTVEYDYIRINDRLYLLPSTSVLESTDRHGTTRNEVQFHSYRKFGAESQLKFGRPPEGP